ncbi:oxidoreductase [Sphaerisporangium fuscum]|uniref:oxidoreductase n=1 Tax=Sphaerisporangium fuscum TaxID=2835868 RepID=UPI001BDD871E|nr:oxidoreductase [Sphaerisporangium fuscum]
MSGWTANDIPDLRGRTAIVTGGNRGLGLVTALELARRGADVVMAGRDLERTEAAVARVRAEVPDAKAEPGLLDLASLASVREFSAKTVANREKIDLLVGNAGAIMVPEWRATADGFEAQFGTNHLGHFALTALLLPALLAAPEPRVVTVTSLTYRQARLDFGDLQSRNGYRPSRAYGRSKLAQLVFALELARRARAAGLGLRSLAAHPGWATTNPSGNVLVGMLERVMANTPERGALPTLYAATAPGAGGGDVVGPDGVGQVKGLPRKVPVAGHARDTGVAARLWEESERLTGVRLSLPGEHVRGVTP